MLAGLASAEDDGGDDGVGAGSGGAGSSGAGKSGAHDVTMAEKGGGGGGKAASGISKKEWRPRGKRGSAGKSGMQRDNLGAKTAKAATSKAAAPP